MKTKTNDKTNAKAAQTNPTNQTNQNQAMKNLHLYVAVAVATAIILIVRATARADDATVFGTRRADAPPTFTPALTVINCNPTPFR
jgi:hypothetical protein